jgi:hypothetical protein
MDITGDHASQHCVNSYLSPRHPGTYDRSASLIVAMPMSVWLIEELERTCSINRTENFYASPMPVKAEPKLRTFFEK